MRLVPFLILVAPGMALAQDAPFTAEAGHYHEALLPAEVACPTAGWFLAPDGQLLERKAGGDGVVSVSGLSCEWAAMDGAICAPGAVVDGVLVVPPPGGGGLARRLTALPDGELALTRPGGGDRPTVLRRCPEAFATMLPGATPEAFAAVPPPVQMRDPSEGPWATVARKPLPAEGVFALFPRTTETRQFMEMIANSPPEAWAALASSQGLTAADLTPDTFATLMEQAECGRAPYVLTRSGQMLRLRLRDDGGEAWIEGVSTCAISQGVLACTVAQQDGDGWIPGTETRRWLWEVHAAGGPTLCNPDLGRDHPNSCSQMVACPAAVGTVSVRDGGDIAALVDWWPGQ